jgi:kynurenine formamidase
MDDRAVRQPAETASPDRTLVDLSMPIVEHWRFQPQIDYRSNVAAGQPFHSTDLTFGAHSFTHVDAPWHVEPDGSALGDVDLGRLWGDAAVIDCCDLGDDGRISAAELETRAGHLRTGDIALLRTDHETRHPTTEREYWTAAPWVDASAARWLRERGIASLGADFPQDRATRAPYDPDFTPLPDQTDDWATHRELLAHGIPLIEYLTNLGSIPGPRTVIMALPLNITKADGSPVRAVALG